MKKLILSIGILVAAFSSVSAQKMEEETSTITKVGDNLPSFTFELSADKKVNIEDYKGKVILINLFATWCPPCNAELPEVENKYGKNIKMIPALNCLFSEERKIGKN